MIPTSAMSVMMYGRVESRFGDEMTELFHARG